MLQDQIMLLSLLFFTIAMLYSSIGHAGASGYLAVMALLSIAPETIKPTSLILNIIVAAIASFKFIRAGYFDKKIFSIFIFTSIPFAYLGGHLTLPAHYFKLIAGIFLLFSAVMLILKQYLNQQKELKKIGILTGAIVGAIIGFFSGLIGVGGGIFLTPILILCNWSDVRKAAGISALFILFNSIAGLLGHLENLQNINSNIIYYALAVISGGFLGTYFAIKKFNQRIITILLFIVLFTAGLKFIFVDFLK